MLSNLDVKNSNMKSSSTKKIFYFHHILISLIALFGLYLLVAWASYSPSDNAWSIANTASQIQNKAGVFGAWAIDLCFSLFGKIGNFVPFITFLIPVLILTKHIALTSFWRVLGICVGVLLFLVSLSVLATLLSPTFSWENGGGAIGGLLVQVLYPTLKEHGILFIAIFTMLLGFLLGAGTALFKALASLYAWINVKEPQMILSSPQTDNVEPVELEEVQLRGIKPQQSSATNSIQVSEQENLVDAENQPEIADISDTHHKLTNTEKSVVATQDKTVSDKASYLSGVSQVEVSGQSEESQAEVKQVEKGETISENTVRPNIIGLTTASSLNADDTDREPLSDLAEPIQQPEMNQGNGLTTDFELPTVEIVPAEVSVETTEDITKKENLVDEFAQHQAKLAQEFAELERQKYLEMEQRAKELNAEDVLHNILNPVENQTATQNINNGLENSVNPIANSPTVSEALMPEIEQKSEDTSPSVELVETGVSKPETPNYKPYAGSLIHPLLQPKTLEKPTTPMPSLDLLDSSNVEQEVIAENEITEISQRIEQQLRNFNIKATVRDVLVGPVVTRYDIELHPGVKASRVTSIETDLARSLMLGAIRIAEMIPGKPYVGIETPNRHRQVVPLRDVLDSEEFRNASSPLAMALGKDISGKPVIVDLAKMPHLLVAGSTGSGKSVGVNTMILSLLFKVKPDQVKFIMIDPKQVELNVYNDIPHLLTEVVTDMKKAANALRWCVDEMERRYQLLSALRVRNLEGYNEKIEQAEAMGLPIPNPIWRPNDTMDTMPPALEKLPYIVVIVDEFADLMMIVGKSVEELIARLAQKARAIGIHLILATQRPSVDVITGLIKSNIPSRIAFTVASKIDSRTILDTSGAESLLGKGDMLYSGTNSNQLVRVHGAFMTTDEVVRVADDWRARGKPEYLDAILETTDDEQNETSGRGSSGDLDDRFDEAVSAVLNTGNTSATYLQRSLGIGFPRAARILDQMEEQGILSSPVNGKREILDRREY